MKAGSKITIEVESNKTSAARGIGLYKNSYAAENLIGEQFTPTAKEAKTWEIAEDCDVVVWNTSGCHIYTIKVKAPAAPAGYTVSMKDGVKDADKWTVKVGEGQAQALPIGGLKEGDPVTLQYNGRLKVKGVKATSEAGAPAVDPLAVPLTIEAITAGTITMTKPKEGMQYSLNGGAKTAVTATINVAAGDKVAFYGNGTTITSYGAVGSSQCTKITTKSDGFTCKVYGNIMSLVDEENFATATTLSATYTFKLLFGNNRAITDASGLLLPATQLAEYCYSEMFEGCSALTAAPALPATQLAASCYQKMFMGCSALTAAPVLPAETLVDDCYYQLFANCSRLATVTCLATSGINLSSSTTLWLNGAGSQAQGTKTVYTVSSAVWPEESNNGIPTGWTRVNKQ